VELVVHHQVSTRGLRRTPHPLGLFDTNLTGR
jgi:hypothetical protein